MLTNLTGALLYQEKSGGSIRVLIEYSKIATNCTCILERSNAARSSADPADSYAVSMRAFLAVNLQCVARARAPGLVDMDNSLVSLMRFPIQRLTHHRHRG